MDEQKTLIRRLAVGGIVVLSLVPVGLAAWNTERVPVARPMQGGIERPTLVFSQYSVNLGEVRPVETIPARFDFWNNGPRPIKITEIEPSCGCLAPKLFDGKTTYQPGEQGRFLVGVNTANEKPGEKEYRIRVRYDDGQPREQTVYFRMTLPAMKVSVTPSEVYFYQLNGQPDSREIHVTDHRGASLEVQGASISSHQASVTVGEMSRTPEGHSTTPIRIDVPGDVSPGREIAVITILTNDPEFRQIQVPVLIHGPQEKVRLTGGEREE
jgi:hypothetical protein